MASAATSGLLATALASLGGLFAFASGIYGFIRAHGVENGRNGALAAEQARAIAAIQEDVSALKKTADSHNTSIAILQRIQEQAESADERQTAKIDELLESVAEMRGEIRARRVV